MASRARLVNRFGSLDIQINTCVSSRITWIPKIAQRRHRANDVTNNFYLPRHKAKNIIGRLIRRNHLGHRFPMLRDEYCFTRLHNLIHRVRGIAP